MKFLAMLRDSLRETLDAKLFYVMIALSLLVVVLAGSVTYRPVTMKQRLEAEGALLSLALGNQPGMEHIDFRLTTDNFARLDAREEPWLGDYRYEQELKFSLREGAGEDDARRMEALRKKIAPLFDPVMLEKRLQQEMFQEAEVEKVEQADKKALRVRITTKGTKFKGRHEWFHQPSLFFGAVDLPVRVLTMSGIITFIATWVVGTFGAAFTMLVSIVLTASFLPNMLAKGTVDLLVTKPMSRPTLLLYKFLGGLLFMALNTAVVMAGLYVVLGLQAGVWLTTLLLLVPLYTLLFAILYSVSALAAVLTRNAIVCILLACLTWAVLFTVGWAHFGFVENRREGVHEGQQADEDAEARRHWAYLAFDAAYQLTPRYKELDWLGNKLLEQELLRPRETPADAALAKAQQKVYAEQLEKLDKRYGSYSWGRALGVTLGFIAVMLALACWRFSVKDY